MRKLTKITRSYPLYLAPILVLVSILIFKYNPREKFEDQKNLSPEQILKNYESKGVPKISRKPSSFMKNGIYADDNKQNSERESSASSDYSNYKRVSNSSGAAKAPTLQDNSHKSKSLRAIRESELSQLNEQLDNSQADDQNSPAGQEELVAGNPTMKEGQDNGDSGSSSSNESSSSSKTDKPEIQSTPGIRGTIPPLTELMKVTSIPFINDAVAAMSLTCTTPKLQLFDLVTMTPLADNPLSIDSITKTTSFEFNPVELDLDMTKPTLYFLKTSGCSYTFERIVTSYYIDQNITQASTVISQLVKTQLKDKVIDVDADSVNSLIAKLENSISSDEIFEDTYAKLESGSLGSEFTDLFLGTPDLLKDSLPDLKTLTVPSTIVEKATHNFEVTTAPHWSSTYTTAYEWLLDDLNDSLDPVLMSTTSQWLYTPGANHSNNFKIILRVGKDDSTGRVITSDTNIPYHEFSWTYPDTQINSQFLDAYPVTAPVITLNAGQVNPTNNLNINLDVATGSALVNCESFSNFAITHSATTPLATDFTYACTDDLTQAITHTLSSGDGDRSIYIWAIDTNGLISSSKSTLINIDQTPPTITIPVLNANYRADTSFVLNWTIDEVHSSTTLNHTVELLNLDGSTWTTLSSTVPSANGPLTAQNFSYSYTLPDRAQVGTKYRITIADTLGNTASVMSSLFELQKPILSTTDSTYSFGSVPNNSTSAARLFTISNTGTGATKNCTAPALTGVNASEFQIINDNCNTSVLAASSSCTYEVQATPTSKGAKSATVTWTCDTDITSASISYNSINVIPVAGSDLSISVIEDTLKNFNVSAGSDTDSDPLTYTIVTPPSNGVLSNCLASNGDLNCDYMPATNYNGADFFTYKVNDGTADSAGVTTVNITVTPVNDVPTIAATQAITTNEDTPITFDLNLGSDVDGDTLSYIIVSNPASGSLSCVGGISRSCTYTPALNFNGTTTFTYKVNDGSADSTISTATITINAVNDAPVKAADYSLITNEDTAKSFTAFAATDVDGDPLTYTIISAPTNGTLTNCMASNADLTCLYTPNVNYNGTDSFTYRAFDGTASSVADTLVTITVVSVNDVPTIAATQAITTNEDTPITFDLNLGSDVDGDTLSYIIVSNPASGSLSCVGGISRSCTYTPALNFNGTTTFTYKVNDGSADSTISTATITINAVNDAPVASANYAVTVRDNLTTSITLSPGSDVDTASGSLVYKLTLAPSIGTLSNCITTSTYSSDLTCDYYAPLNYDGPVTIKYIVNDGSLDSSNETTVTINVEDQTPTIPNLIAANFTEGSSTNANPLTLTAVNCTDVSKVLITESTATPLATDSGWQTCSTAAGSLSFDPTVSNIQGFRTLRIFGIDPVGNISSYDSMDFIFDSMAPSIVFDTIPTLPWGIQFNIKWKLTEATISASKNHTVSISYNNGSTWSVVGSVSVASNGPHSQKYYSYTYTVPSGTLYTNVIFKVSVSDDNGMTGTGTSNSFRIVEDLGAPFIHNATFKINGSITPPATSVKYVNIDFNAEDLDTVLTHFCLKGNDTTAPLADDSCWTAFDAPSPGLTLNNFMSVTNFSYLLGFTPANFKVSIWVRDLAGNISSNTDSTAGKDFVIMNYTPDPPPSLSNLFVTNSDSPTNPVSDTDLTFNNGDIVYINWRATDNKPIPAGSIDISYTTDDINFTPIASATNIDNGTNNCPTINSATNPLDDSATGCFRWTFPLADGQYFKINIVASDDAYQDTSTTSVALNSVKFKILAGNVDPGTGSSAKSAQLFPRSSGATPYSIAVSTDGKIFFNDAKRGLLYINPYTNVLEQLLPDTGASTGDGGPVTNATATEIYKINMDFQDRLLVWDNYSIRRIDTTVNPMTIETIIGYRDDGTRGTNRSDTVLDPKDFKLEAPGSVHIFQPLPNGDIWFADKTGSVSGSNNLIRIYKGSLSSPRLESIRVSGSGGSSPPSGASAISGNTSVTPELENENIVAYQIAFDMDTSNVTSLFARYYRGLNGCSYLMRELIDPNTHLAEGTAVPSFDSTCVDSFDRTTNDGKIWAWSYHTSAATRIAEYNPATNSYNATKLGNGIHGTCPDGTLATSCMLRLQDFYVASDGTFFFLDSNTIRVIDSDGYVQTLYGQSRSYGDGGLGQDARFGTIYYIDHGVGDNVIMVDNQERIIREIRPNEVSNQVIRVAGNGTLARGPFDMAVAAKDQMLDTGSWSQTFSFASNPANGEVYYACSWHSICKLSRSTGLWSYFFGTDGGTHWLTNSDAAGTSFDAGGYTPSVNGFFNGSILSGHYDWSGTKNRNGAFRLTSTSTGISTYVAGKSEEVGATSCPSGPGTNCNIASVRQNGSAATWDAAAGKVLFELSEARSSYQFRYLSSNSIVTAFSYPEYFHSIVKVGNIIYGCTEANILKKWDTSTGTVTTLPIPGTAQCHGYRILYKPASGSKPNRLVFPFNQNGLHGIAEYFL